jgi:tRNA U34 5-carboxymethylaminomethyl modifying GTPase MnmE/TrmE
MSLNDTPSASRLHIVLVGKRNSGKSSLLNALVGQHAAIVSAQPGTTTDPIGKAIEIHGLGACVITDTAGVDDSGQVGSLRVEKTLQALRRADIVTVVVALADIALEVVARRLEGKARWWWPSTRATCSPMPHARPRPFRGHRHAHRGGECRAWRGIDRLRQTFIGWAQWRETSYRGGLEGDLVMLIMPQDREAPQGRLILRSSNHTRTAGEAL